MWFDLVATTLRRIMGLDGGVRITKKYLRESMSMQVYEMARLHYEQLLRQQVEEDVPDHAPPSEQTANLQFDVSRAADQVA
jgi:hypothetical protein